MSERTTSGSSCSRRSARRAEARSPARSTRQPWRWKRRASSAPRSSSSSITRSASGTCLVHREPQGNARPVRLAILELEAAADVAREALHDGEAEPRSMPAGAVEGPDAAGEHLRREARPVVGDGEAELAPLLLRRDDDLTAGLRERLRGVQHQVQERLPEAVLGEAREEVGCE